MAGPLPDAFTSRKNDPAQATPYIWLLSITNDEDLPVVDLEGRERVLNLTSQRVAVPFGEEADGDPRIFYPWDFRVGGISSRSDGSIDSIGISFSNAYGYASRFADLNDDFRRHIVRLSYVNVADLADPSAAAQVKARVSRLAMRGFEAVTLQVGGHPLDDQSFPYEQILPGCRFRYRGARCGFTPDRDPENTLGPCAHTIGACIARGIWEVDNGLAASLVDADHPFRFGGFKGAPTGNFV